MDAESITECSIPEIQELVGKETSLPEKIGEVMESDIKDLVDMDIELSGIAGQLEERISDFKKLIEKVVEKRRSIVSQLQKEKKKRDELNKVVQKAAKKVRERIDERKEVKNLIDEKHERLDEVRENLSEKQEKLEKLKENVQNFNIQQKRKVESKLERVNWNLQTRSLPESIEKRLVKLSKSLRGKLKKYEEKAENLKKVKQLEREIEELKQEKKALKSGLAVYYKEKNNLTEKIHKFAKKRNEKKDIADEHHQKVIECAEKIDELNEALSQIKQTRVKLIQTLRKINGVTSERRKIKEKERLKEVMRDKVMSISQKLKKKGSLNYNDLQFLLEHGFLSDEIMREIPDMSHEEKRKKILKRIESQIE